MTGMVYQLNNILYLKRGLLPIIVHSNVCQPKMQTLICHTL